jgi:TolA-binding protein
MKKVLFMLITLFLAAPLYAQYNPPVPRVGESFKTYQDRANEYDDAYYDQQRRIADQQRQIEEQQRQIEEMRRQQQNQQPLYAPLYNLSPTPAPNVTR